jgi:hypothetical protein
MGSRILLVAALIVVSSSQVALAEPGDELTVSAITFGPGDHPFFKFGHNAILVQSTKEEGGQIFNFGTFAFDSPGLIFKFLAGRFNYWLSVSGMESAFEAYIYENRTIEVQELDLLPSQKWALWNNGRTRVPRIANTSTTTSGTTALPGCAMPSIALWTDESSKRAKRQSLPL